MRRSFWSLLCVCALFLASPALAKEKKAGKKMDEQAMMELWKQMATPGAPHKMLAGLTGSWTTKTKEWMDPAKPATESDGTAEIKTLMDDRFIYQEYHGQMMGQPFAGIGIDGYDNMKKKYVTAWMDSMGTGIFIMEGTAGADGRTITLKGSHPEPGGGQMHHRAVWKIVDNNNQVFEMYGTHHGQKESKVLEIVYTRKP